MNKFENSIATTPVWSGNVVYNETFWPVDDGEENADLTIGLLYPIEEVISVTDTRLQREYDEGDDYEVRGGKLVIRRNGGIKLTPWNEFQLSQEQTDAPFHIGCTLGGWLFFAEGSQITDKQYCVTYRHSGAWDSYIPRSEKTELPRTKKRIAEKQPFNFAFFGDSIAYGCNSSGLKDINIPPYAPIWAKMTTDALNLRGVPVGYINRAVGGMDSAWGAREAYNLFKDDKFDLFLIAFGMNDGDNTNFGANTEKMMNDILSINPDCEFLLVSTTLPHKLASGFFRGQAMQQMILEQVKAKFADRAALVPMTDMHAALLSRKRFYDMTGNNVNHPNDFLAAVYAQTILSVIEQ